jgi:hypothetical protein
MNNGSNDFGVAFSQIMFLERILGSHENVRQLYRHDDIVFEIERVNQMDALTIVCVEAYSVSEELVARVVEAFPSANVIYYGGKWNGATKEATEFCRDRNIGLYNAGTFAPAIRHKDFGRGPKQDDDSGDPSNSTEA